MLIAADIGNSNIKFAVFNDNNDILLKFRISSKTKRSADEIRLLIKQFLSESNENLNIDSAVITSVVPSITSSVYDALSVISSSKPFTIGTGTRTGFKIRIDDASELGADIVANVASARSKLKAPFVVIDTGTATTVTAVDKNGDIIGVIIHPGIKVCKSALLSSAAKLSDVSLEYPEKLIGQNSEESIKSGIIFGHICMINGLVSMIKQELCADGETLGIIATGRNSALLAPYLAEKPEIDEDLALRGSASLFRLNRKKR